MRLVNTATLQFEDFPDESGLRYVILSHRWEEEEVSFQDMKILEEAKKKKGFRKLESFCEEALQNGFQYAWMDTCCIDKSSSAELSEAINSMFRWYQNAHVCFAFLSDVGREMTTCTEEFKQSKWFTRGWTLQELLAPKTVHFYNVAWIRFSSREEFVPEISEITGIDEEALRGRNLLSFSTAQRMRWAAHRKTTRMEDQAYSLIGLFNVNMPMLYGEGNKAFLRLQEEIIRRSHDLSILAWSGVSSEGSGLLAISPAYFVELGWETNVFPLEASRDLSITNRGLSTLASLTPWTNSIYFMRLRNVGLQYAAGIFLRRLHDGRYRRVRLDDETDILYGTEQLSLGGRTFRDVKIYVEQDDLMSHLIAPPSDSFGDLEYGVRINRYSNLNLGPYISSQGEWDPETKIATLRPGQFGAVAEIDVRRLNKHIHWIRFGFNYDGILRCVLAARQLNFFTNESRLGWKEVRAVTFDEEDGWSDFGGDRGYVDVLPCPGWSHVQKGNEKWALQVQSQIPRTCKFMLIRTAKTGSREEVGKVVFTSDMIGKRAIWAVDIDI